MWLYILTSDGALTPDPLDAHFPIRKIASPDVICDCRVNLPRLDPPSEIGAPYNAEFEDYAVETLEWLSLVQLGSPRIDPDDKIDPFLSRYVPPGDSYTSCNVVKIKWEGFLSPSWAHKTFSQILVAIPREAWCAYYVAGFREGPLGESKQCTILKLAEAPNEYMLWEIS